MAINFTNITDQLESLYIGYFGRAGDPAGMAYWTGAINSGSMTSRQTAASFSVQTEATTKYPYLASPTTSDSAAFIDQVYTNLFNRLAEPAGKAYWLAQLTAGRNSPETIGTFIQNVISGALGVDITTLTNKVAVGTRFTNDLAAANMAFTDAVALEAKREIAATDSTTASVTVNQASADAFTSTNLPVVTPVLPPAGQTFALSPASASVNEGATDLITLTTTGVAAGTSVAYSIAGIAAARVTGGLTGTATVDGTGHATINLGIVANNLTDGATTAVVNLTSGFASTSVLVNDTSLTPVSGASQTVTVVAGTSAVGGAGNDTFLANASDGGTNSLQPGSVIAGGAGNDTLSITPNIPTAATTLNDNLWTNVSSIENLSITTGAGVITLVSGAAFNTAFAGGVNLSAATTGGAINLDMTTFTGADSITASSGAGAETIVTGSGATNVSATSTAGALTIHGVGLTSVTATTTGAGAQTIGDLIGGGAALTSVTATANAGAQVIHSTSTGAVTVNATSVSGPQTITTGSGNDSIVIGSSGAAGTINAGAGTNTIALGATHSGVDQIIVTPGNSTQTSVETITNFSMAVSDTLALGTTTLLNSAQLGGGFTVTGGIATGGTVATLAGFLAAATTSTTAGVVAYVSGGSTYVVASDGLASGAADTEVQLVGLTSATAVGGAAAATMIHIV